MKRTRKRTRNAACHPVAIPGPTLNRKRGYVPTAQRNVVSFGDLKGSEKRALIMREWARQQGMYVGDDTRGSERQVA